ncbi:MAG: hypothetical protein ACLFSW_00410 [Halobacteriales archaeon]
MEHRTQRRLSAVVGVFLLVITAAVVAVFRGSLLDRPLLAAQVGALAVAGVLDIAAAFDTPVTERVAWYRLSGLGNVFLAVSLPLGLFESAETLPLLLVVLGSTTLAAIGFDMLVFDGRHVYSEPLDTDQVT